MNEQLQSIFSAIQASEVLSSHEITLAKFGEAAAISMGRSLFLTANWQGVRCNWPAVGSEEEEVAKSSEIALFLAQIYAETAEPDFCETARGALAQAVYAQENASQEDDLVVFANAVSLAYYAIKIGFLLDASDLVKQGLAQLTKLNMPEDFAAESDLISSEMDAVMLLMTLRGGPGMPKYHNITL